MEAGGLCSDTGETEVEGLRSHTGQMYAAALKMAVQLREPLDTQLDDLVQALARDGASPADVVRLHLRYWSGSAGEAVGDRSAYEVGLQLLERVVNRLQPDHRRIVHDLRNSMQILSMSLSLLERDLVQNAGARAVELVQRTNKSVQELARRIERIPTDH